MPSGGSSDTPAPGDLDETVDLALRTLIAVRRQTAAVERIIGRSFTPDQIDAPTITPGADRA